MEALQPPPRRCSREPARFVRTWTRRIFFVFVFLFCLRGVSNRNYARIRISELLGGVQSSSVVVVVCCTKTSFSPGDHKSERLEEGEGEGERERNGGRERERAQSWDEAVMVQKLTSQVPHLHRLRAQDSHAGLDRGPRDQPTRGLRPQSRSASVPDERARHVEPENLGVADVVVRRDELPIDGVHTAGRDGHPDATRRHKRGILSGQRPGRFEGDRGKITLRRCSKGDGRIHGGAIVETSNRRFFPPSSLLLLLLSSLSLSMLLVSGSILTTITS